MSVFGKILSKLGIKKKDNKEEAKAAETKEAVKKAAPKRVDVRRATSKFTAKRPVKKVAAAVAKAKPAPMEMVDVMSKLELMAEGSGLNWKKSIADLLAVLGIDHSLSARKELAKELGCPSELIGGNYAKMNTWLHKTVLQKIAENGGNIPQDLLD